MDEFVGRDDECRILQGALESPDAELIAVLGRRRVGKTFLIRTVYKSNMLFEFSGVHDASLQDQLFNFSVALGTVTGNIRRSSVPGSWMEAFVFLEEYLAPIVKEKKSVIFFDEFPWIQTHRSGFLSAFGHFWNTWASRQQNLVVVICGSAASWMIRHIVNNQGGLHNRITRRIRLLPFNLNETEEYLQSRKVNLDRYQILQLYMALGGIPQYLKNIKPGESAAQAIDRLCFTKDGGLIDEFRNLYQSLFDNAENHIAIIIALAAKGMGLTRTEAIQQSGLSSGGTTSRLFEELAESGFITAYIPLDKKVNDSIYKLTDEYSLFYLKFIEKARTKGPGTWLKLTSTPSWKSWSGFAFEGICFKHAPQIKKALGISGVLTSESVWRYKPRGEEQGTQIDLLIDRTDHCINICEMKFAQSEVIIDKAYAENLRQKENVFRERTRLRKTLFLTMVTTYGVRKNDYYVGLVVNEVKMDALFEK